MSENGSAQPVDYYSALGLNPASPAHALLAQLSHRIAQTTIGPERHLMEQARAILGDPEKKQVYDTRLRDPQAPPWTPAELHELAIAQSTRSATGLLAQLKAAPTRILTAVAGGLLIVLVVVITAVSCTGGSSDVANGDNPASGADEGPESSAPSHADKVTCDLISTKLIGKAAWLGSNSRPDYAVVVTHAFDVPSPLGPDIAKVTDADTSNLGINQYQNKSIGIHATYRPDRVVFQREAVIATFTPDGRLISTKKYPALGTPPAFDLQISERTHYHQIVAVDGITIPAGAGGTEPGQTYALSMRPDAFDHESVWMLLRGGDKLYKGTLIRFRGDTVPTKDLKTACNPIQD